jgi:SAM-dependent methyltransferase
LRETKECGQEFFADFCVREDNVSESGDPHRQQLAHQLVLLDRISRGGPFLDCLAIGCAEDLNIEALGACCESLLVADFSPMALESARQRRQWPGRTAFAGFDLRRDPIPGTFDLIVVVGVLDYFSRPSTFWRIRQKLAAALRPGAHLMIETVRSDDPLLDNFWWNKVMIKGKWINPYIAQHPALTTVEAVETAGYTITVYRKVLAS